MSLLNEIKRDARGLLVLNEWLGSGAHPVSQEQADKRAISCLSGNEGRECPYLVEPNWWDKAVKDPIAYAIKDHLEAKGKLNLQTELDKAPRMCSKCGCCMPTKVWVPIEHIAAHTSEESVNNLPAWCWQRIEIENL